MANLSKRLLAVAGLVTPGSRVADIGTDHAFIPIYLLEQGIAKSAVAMDINEGPLSRAKKHVEESGLTNYIVTRQSDGVLALKKDEADSVIIAGMGGGLVIKILTEGHQILAGVGEFILQPQSEVERVRHFLYDSGYHITKEDMVYEDGKYYPMMHVVHGRENVTYPEYYFRYGGYLIQEKNEVLAQYLEKEEREQMAIKEKLLPRKDKEHIISRLAEIEEKLTLIEAAKTEMRKL